METSENAQGKLPITQILVGLFGVFAFMGIVAAYWYLDFHAGSTSSTLHPSGVEVEAVVRGFGAGATSVGSIRDTDGTSTLLLRVNDDEFHVTAADVVLKDKSIAKIPTGTKKVSIVSYRKAITIEADGKNIASLP